MPISSVLNRMDKGDIVTVKEMTSSLNSFIHHQKTNLTLVEQNIEVLKNYKKREKISLLKSSVESLIERQKLMNQVALVIMEATEKESTQYKHAESECTKFDADIKKATTDVDKLVDELVDELPGRLLGGIYIK